MGRTFLIANPKSTWREWLKANRRGRDLIILDPSDANLTVPGRLSLLRGDKLVESRFYGSLESARAPHVMVAGVVELLKAADEDVLIQLYAYRPTPLLRQLTLLLAHLIAPDVILLAKGTDLAANELPTGPEEVELEAGFPAMVQTAQRKAHWLKLLETCQSHEVELKDVAIDGVRLGSGRRLTREETDRLKFSDAHWAEVSGSSLFVVADSEPDQGQVARALDHLHCTRAHFAAPDAYDGLLCSFARANGVDFGMGMIQRIDFEAGVVYALNTAETPAPVRILRLGSLQINENGTELGESRPWQV